MNVDSSVFFHGDQISMWGRDHEIIKPIVVQIGHEHQAFLFIEFTFQCIGGNRINPS